MTTTQVWCRLCPISLCVRLGAAAAAAAVAETSGRLVLSLKHRHNLLAQAVRAAIRRFKCDFWLRLEKEDMCII